MVSQNKIDQLGNPTANSSTRFSTAVTIPAQAEDRGLGKRFSYSLNAAAGLLVNTASSVGGLVAGAPIVSAAVSQIGQLGGQGGGLQSGLGGLSNGGGVNFAGNGGGGGGGIASSAFGSALTAGPPGLVQTNSAVSSGNPLGNSLMSGIGSNLTGTSAATTSGASVTTGGVSTDAFSSITGSTSSAGGYQNYFSSLGQQQYQMLNLQIAMQQEYQFFATLSNVLKTRNDTIKNSISNIR